MIAVQYNFGWTGGSTGSAGPVDYADNGLTIVSSGIDNTVELGGTLIKNTAIVNGAYYLTVSNLGIGTTGAPITNLEVAANDANAIIVSTRYQTSANAPSGIVARKANGTQASPSALASGDAIGGVGGSGYHSGGDFASASGQIIFTAAENFTSTARGTNIVFQNTPAGSTTIATVATLTSDGYLRFPTTGRVDFSTNSYIGKSVASNGIVINATGAGGSAAWSFGHNAGEIRSAGTYDGGNSIVIISDTTTNFQRMQTSVSTVYWDYGMATYNFILRGILNSDSSPTDIITVLQSGGSAGYVGIGTTSPTTKLHIAGSIRMVDGTQAANSVMVGDANGVATWSSSLTLGGALSVGTTTKMLTTTSGAGTLTLDASTVYVFTGTTTTWTLPVASGGANQFYFLKNRGSGAITLNSNSGTEIYSTSAVASLTINPGEAYILIGDGTYWNVN